MYLYYRQGGYVFTLFVCLLAGLRNIAQPIFTKLDGKVTDGPRKKRLDSHFVC